MKLSEKIADDAWSMTNEEWAADARALEADLAATERENERLAAALEAAEAEVARLREGQSEPAASAYSRGLEDGRKTSTNVARLKEDIERLRELVTSLALENKMTACGIEAAKLRDERDALRAKMEKVRAGVEKLGDKSDDYWVRVDSVLALIDGEGSGEA